MAAIEINAFDGLRPTVDQLLLNNNEAAASVNAVLISGTLAPMGNPTVLKSLTKTAPKTIWRYGNSSVETEYWLEFAAETDVVNAPIPDDQFGRVFWTDGVKPKYSVNSLIVSGSSYPGASYDLGIVKPANAPTASGTAPNGAVNYESRSYVVTYVSAYGEEGESSAPSETVVIDSTQPVSLSSIPIPPTGNHNITLKRIYRSSVVGSAAQYQFVAEIPVAQTTYTDTKKQSELGEILPSDGWIAPPDELAGLKVMANGAGIGFVGKTVYLSEPNLLHAWPNKYTIDFPIVGIGIYQQTAVVLTNSYPFALIGADPAAMSPARLELPQACVSKASIVDTGDGVLYASPDGLVSVGSGGMSVVTKKHLSRDDWQALNPSSMKAFLYEERYIAFYEKANGIRGVLMLDFSGRGAVVSASDMNAAVAVTAGYYDPRTDNLYLAQGTNIVRFMQGTPMTATWKTKMFRFKEPMNLASCAVDSYGYPLTVNFYAGGALVYTKIVASDDPFRLPSGFRERDWQLEIVTNKEVTRIRATTSIAEMKELP